MWINSFSNYAYRRDMCISPFTGMLFLTVFLQCVLCGLRYAPACWFILSLFCSFLFPVKHWILNDHLSKELMMQIGLIYLQGTSWQTFLDLTGSLRKTRSAFIVRGIKRKYFTSLFVISQEHIKYLNYLKEAETVLSRLLWALTHACG